MVQFWSQMNAHHTKNTLPFTNQKLRRMSSLLPLNFYKYLNPKKCRYVNLLFVHQDFLRVDEQEMSQVVSVKIFSNLAHVRMSFKFKLYFSFNLIVLLPRNKDVASSWSKYAYQLLVKWCTVDLSSIGCYLCMVRQEQIDASKEYAVKFSSIGTEQVILGYFIILL